MLADRLYRRLANDHGVAMFDGLEMSTKAVLKVTGPLQLTGVEMAFDNVHTRMLHECRYVCRYGGDEHA